MITMTIPSNVHSQACSVFNLLFVRVMSIECYFLYSGMFVLSIFRLVPWRFAHLSNSSAKCTSVNGSERERGDTDRVVNSSDI